MAEWSENQRMLNGLKTKASRYVIRPGLYGWPVNTTAGKQTAKESFVRFQVGDNDLGELFNLIFYMVVVYR